MHNFARLGSKFEKSTNIALKFFFLKKSIKVSKNAEFHADFESVEKFLKKIQKKVISNSSLTNMSKS